MVVLQCFVYILMTFAFLYAFSINNHVRKELLCTIKNNVTFPRIEMLNRRDYVFLLCFFTAVVLFRLFIDPQSIPDTWYYADNFKIVGNIPLHTLIIDGGADYDIEDEKGFLILTKILYTLLPYQNLYIGIIGCIICCGYYYLIKGYSQIVWMSCILFLLGGFNQSLFVLRQYLAIAVIIFSFSFIIKREFLKYIVCIGIAFLFHRTAIVFLPVYFIYGIENKKLFIIISMASVVVGRIAIITILGHVLTVYSDLAAYASDEEGANIKMALYLSAILIVRLVLLRKCYWDKGVNRLFTIVLLFGTAFSILSYGFGFDRIVVIFSTFLCVIIPQTIISIKKPIIKYGFAITFITIQFYLWMGSLSHLSTMKFL